MTQSTGQIERTPSLGGLALLNPSLRASSDPLRDQGFASILARATSSGDDVDETRKAAEQLVAVTFIQPMLRAAREANNAAPPFAPTAIEKQFGPMMDASLSDSMIHGTRWALIDRIEQDMRRGGVRTPSEVEDRFAPPAIQTPGVAWRAGQ